jgi:hypothetical protein
MNTFRIAAGIAVVASATVLAVAACSDQKPPTVASVPALTVVPGNLASLRAERATLRDRIPARYAWVGEEHNRVILKGIAEFQAAARRDPAEARRMRQSCDYTLALIEREMTTSAARSGLTAGETRRLFDRVSPTSHGGAVCHAKGGRPAQLSVFATPFAGMQGEGEGDAGFAVLERLMDGLDAAADPQGANDAIAVAANEAAALTGLDQDIAFGGVSLALSSADLWSTQTGNGGTLSDGAPYAMALFRQAMVPHDVKTFGKFVKTDVGGCVAGAGFVQKFIKDFRPVLAGCFLTGVAASLSWYLM